MTSRINGAIARLANDQPVFYTGSHTGAELTFEAGMAMADTWADYINIGMEHGPLDIPGLNRFMQGMASVRTPTPIVLVELPFEGRNPDLVRANAWQVRQLLATGVHGFLLCHAERPEAVAAVVEAMRYTFRDGTRGSGGQAARRPPRPSGARRPSSTWNARTRGHSIRTANCCLASRSRIGGHWRMPLKPRESRAWRSPSGGPRTWPCRTASGKRPATSGGPNWWLPGSA